MDSEGWEALAAWVALAGSAGSWWRASRKAREAKDSADRSLASQESVAESLRSMAGDEPVKFIAEWITPKRLVVRSVGKLPEVTGVTLVNEEGKPIMTVLPIGKGDLRLATNEATPVPVMGGVGRRSTPVNLRVRCNESPTILVVRVPPAPPLPPPDEPAARTGRPASGPPRRGR